jgi:hypothetical protein
MGWKSQTYLVKRKKRETRTKGAKRSVDIFWFQDNRRADLGMGKKRWVKTTYSLKTILYHLGS